MPDAKPCVNLYIYMVPANALRLQYVSGERQVINTAQTFSPVSLRVTDSASPPNPVKLASVAVLSAVFRWQPSPLSTGWNTPPPPAPVILSSALATVYSDGNGMVSITSSPAARLGAVVVKVIAFPGAGPPLQFELQRLWAPPGWVASGNVASANRAAATQSRRIRRPISSSRYPPTD